jgi:hypothetical protein
LADYREHYVEIRAAGASVVAVSVDAPDKSEALGVHLSLPFPIVCDTEHRVVRDWGIYNGKGSAIPIAVFGQARNAFRYLAAKSWRLQGNCPVLCEISICSIKSGLTAFDPATLNHWPSNEQAFRELARRWEAVQA